MEHAFRLLAAALHQMWKDGGIALHPKGGLVIRDLDAFGKRGSDHLFPFLTHPIPGLAFFGLLERGVATGLFGRPIDGEWAFHPVPWQGPATQLAGSAPTLPFPPASFDPVSPYLLGFSLSESTPKVQVGSTAFGMDLEWAAAGMALDVFGVQNGTVRAVLRKVVAPFYGRCVVLPDTFVCHAQGWSVPKGGATTSVGQAMDRAFLSLMAAHGIDAGHLAVAPTTHFSGHMLLPLDVQAMSMHTRLEAIALWRRHSA